MATHSQSRCWLVPDALAHRLDDVDGGVALWLHELQRLSQPTGLGWDPSLKIVSPGAADLDSGCFNSDDDVPLARSRKLADLSDTVGPMDSDGSSECSECSSEDSLEGDEWCLQECRTLPVVFEEDEEDERDDRWMNYGKGSTEVIPWEDALVRTPLEKSRSEGELAERSKPRFFHTTYRENILFDIFPFDLFDEEPQPVRQLTFDEVETEVLNTSEEMRRLCQSPVVLEDSPDVLDDDLLTLFFEADNFANECLSHCGSPVHQSKTIFDTGESSVPPVPPVRKKKLKRPRPATSDELLLLTRATERTKLKRSRSLSGDVRRSGVTSSRVVTSDLLEWKRQLLWSALLSDEDEDDMIIADMKMEKWFSSNDGKGHVYYFEENSNESSWTLPEVSLSPRQEHETERDPIQQEDADRQPPEVSDDEDTDVPPKTLAAELAAQLAKRCRAFPESNIQTADKFASRAAKSRSMILIDSDLKDGSPKEIATPKNWPQLSEGAMNVLKEGTLNRTKITENGKKLRKNWASSHVVLTELCLLLFRDAKTFAAMKAADKNPGTNAPRPELSMDLNGAIIDRADRPDKLFATSRKNVFLVSTVLGIQVLFQCECSSQTDEWFYAVQAAIKKLPCGLDICPRKDSDRLTSGPYSPEQNKKFPRIGRSKSVKLKSKDGSIEDLTVSTAERQTKIRARLKKFFNRRPTMESLVKKGIWKDEPAFGCYLEQACGTESPRVPVFVQKCIAVIESKADNMKTDGLYRASGNLSQVQKIRLQVDQNNMAVLEQEEDVHVLTGTLKLFFRELKEPLIPYASFSKAIKASMNHSKKEKIAQFREIIKSLPAPNHDTLKFLLKHLLKVTSYQEFNRMHIPNLAIVFGPTLMWPEQESLNMALDLMQQNLVIETLLLDFDAIFR